MSQLIVNTTSNTCEVRVNTERNEITFNKLNNDGKSAYEIAVINGFVGTEQEFAEALIVKTFIRRHDFVANASYCGYAETESLETASVWNITKILIAVDGSTTKTTATNVKWSDRLTLTYS
jgi:hypothetical protein